MSSAQHQTTNSTRASATRAGLLDDYLSDDELAVELKTTTRTLNRWDNLRIGPPRTYIGRKPYYHRDGVKEWLRRREQTFEKKPNGSRRQPHR